VKWLWQLEKNFILVWFALPLFPGDQSNTTQDIYGGPASGVASSNRGGSGVTRGLSQGGKT